MDIARWMIPGATLPKSVVSLGGRLGYKDQGQTPNTQVAVFVYGDAQLIFEVRGLKAGPYLGQTIGNMVHLEGGTIAGGKFTPKGSSKPEPLAKVDTLEHEPEGNHFGNFITAVRSRKSSDLNADILQGHYSAALCHLANVSYRLGEPVSFGSSTRPFDEGTFGADAFGRMKEHLGKENGLSLEGESYRMGRKLAFDPKGETFVDAPEACKLLTRSYRKPFTVPESIA
jgi:hypothetical protein